MGVGNVAPQSVVLSRPPSPADKTGQLLSGRHAKSLVSAWSASTSVNVSLHRGVVLDEHAALRNMFTELLVYTANCPAVWVLWALIHGGFDPLPASVRWIVRTVVVVEPMSTSRADMASTATK